MERIRGPVQGVWNILRFNWPFYGLAAGLLMAFLLLRTMVAGPYDLYWILATGLIAANVLVSLLTSFYVYDRSDLYHFSWLDDLINSHPREVVTIHAGFDETTALLQRKYPQARVHVFDFYNPDRHTEASIKRARRAYPPHPATQAIETSAIPLGDQVADCVFLILAAHEIRQETERIRFFTELSRVLKPTGRVIVVEHLRDGANFLAYTIGFLHFLPKSAWLATFARSAFTVCQRLQVTPFVTVFILQKHG